MMIGEKERIKRICIISGGYPSEKRAINTFVDQLVCEFADMGMDCTVISPQSATNIVLGRSERLPYYRERETLKGSVIRIYTPRFLSASTYRKGMINTAPLTLKSFTAAARRVFRSLNGERRFDAVYGHFIFPSGMAASSIGGEYKVPAFLAYGENTNYTIDWLGAEKTRRNLGLIKGVVSVSSANAQNLIRQDIVKEEIIGIFPNSVNKDLFYPRDKRLMRRKYGFPEDAFIIAFVGRFVDIKGANRLSAAIDKLGAGKVKSIFIGSGDAGPSCEGILLAGPQPHGNIPELLSASDVFVLPTLAEGCCNAIIEAMACGLPVISSDRDFNDDILDDACSIRIDPNSIAAVANAIELLRNDNALRGKLAEGALSKAKQLDIETRARNIINFMESKILR
jgi:glycosyltransferase involved in cell wall biosynthesis